MAVSSLSPSGLLETTGTNSSGTFAVSVAGESLTAKAQRMLGIDERFEDLHRIGGGGTCEIFRGWDQQLQRWVALKRLGSRHTNRSEDRRAHRWEYDVLRGLKHDAVPSVDEYFPEPMFKPYFSMDLVNGITLCRILRALRHGVDGMNQRFPLARLLAILEVIGQCLIESHADEIIHRDLKPENIMVDEDGQIRLIDWGTAQCIRPSSECQRAACQQSVDQEPRDDRRSTPSSTLVIGSPLYMPPEQTYPNHPLDERADVFSMGAVLYDCLALTTLNPGQNLAEVISYTRAGQYRRPSKITLRSDLPGFLDEFCLAAITAEPDHRLANMTAFVDGIRDCRQRLSQLGSRVDDIKQVEPVV